MLHPDTINAAKKRAIIYDASGNALSQLTAMGIKPERIFSFNPMYRYCFEPLLSAILVDPVITREFFFKLGTKDGGKMDKTSKYFLGEAVKCATDVVTTLIRAANDQGKEPLFGLWEICNICLDQDTLTNVLNTYPDIGRKYKNIRSGSAQNEGIFGSLSELFDPILPFANAYKRSRDEGRIYNLDDFPTSNHMLLMTRNDERGGDALNTIYGMKINTLISKIIGKHADGRTKPASTFFIADEFQNLGKLDALVKIASEGGRYGFCIMLATQTYGRIRDIYGDGDTNSLIGNITHLVSLRNGDPDTAKYMSSLFGDSKIERTTISQSTGKNASPSFNTTIVNEALFSSGVFLNLAKLSEVEKTPMEVIAKCDSMRFKTTFPWQDLQKMLPPEASDELKAQDVAPQDRQIFFPNPLTSDDFIALGLPHLADLADDDDDV